MRRIGFKARTLVVNDALIALVAGAGEGRASSSWRAPGRLPTGVTERPVPLVPGVGLHSRRRGWRILDRTCGAQRRRAGIRRPRSAHDAHRDRPRADVTEQSHRADPCRVRRRTSPQLPSPVWRRSCSVRRTREMRSPLTHCSRRRGTLGAAASVITRLEMRGDCFR
jgi:hypothetical protein